jgi:ribosomal protein S18 acetylase RimI-like enzyme
LKAIFHEYSNNLNHPPDRFDSVLPESLAKVMDDALASQEQFIIVAELDNVIVGDLSFRGEMGWSKHCGEFGMAVRKEFHGMGIGRAILEHCFEEAKRLGFTNLKLRVRTFNAPAIALYERMGFEKIGLIKSAAKIPSGFVDEFMYQKLMNIET